jgi:cytochrome c553
MTVVLPLQEQGIKIKRYAKYKAQPESFIYGKVKAFKNRSRT